MSEKKNQQQESTLSVPKSQLTEDLKKKLNEIAFSNRNIEFLSDESATVKSKMGRRGGERVATPSSLPGLARLGSSVSMPSGYKKRK